MIHLSPLWRSIYLRVLVALLAWQLFASTVTTVRGFPYYGTSLVSNAPAWELPIALWHLPAIELLSLSGYCCGLNNQLVFESRVRGGHVPMKPVGAAILAASSLAFWVVVALVGVTLWRRRRPVEEVVVEMDEKTGERSG